MAAVAQTEESELCMPKASAEYSIRSTQPCHDGDDEDGVVACLIITGIINRSIVIVTGSITPAIGSMVAAVLLMEAMVTVVVVVVIKSIVDRAEEADACGRTCPGSDIACKCLVP